MVPELGLFCLILAFALAAILAVLPFSGLSPKWTGLQALARPAAFGQCFFILLSFLTLTFCFVQNDFTVEYVAKNSYSGLPLIYKICAVWGAHEGSLLLWSLILALWTLAVTLYSRQLPPLLVVRVLGVLSALQFGFLLILLHTSNPFSRLLPLSPSEGLDLNPLLQDPGFVLHPPFLYLGYVGFAVPFAFALVALMEKEPKFAWARYARPWALLAWSFLTIGITLGSWWAYYELGWGGWWFWDPVENASFMPWLMGAASTHALLVAARSHSFAPWSIFLSICTFVLSLIGTFLVRSGVLSSVHAFASDPLRGVFILGFLGSVLIVSMGLYFRRLGTASLPIRTAVFSQQSFLLLGNMLFFVATLTVLLGTLYPLIIEVLQQQKISVGPPYFNAVFVPMVLPLLVLIGVVPQLRWQGDPLQKLWQRMKRLIWGFIPLVIALIFFGRHFSILALIGMVCGAWVLAATLFKMGAPLVRGELSLSQWGMFFAHVGVGIGVLGIALTISLETEKELKMAVGDTVKIQGESFTFVNLEDTQGSNYEGLRGHFIVKQGNKVKAHLYPEKRYFIPRQIPMTETAIAPGFGRDIYIALGEKLDGGWSVRIYLKPFIRWIWLGGLLIAVGAFLASISAFKRSKD